jgi:hypothetical protein
VNAGTEATEQEVRDFLSEFVTALDFGQFYFKPREKNLQALAQLGATVEDVKAVIRALTPQHYAQGPSPDETDDSKEVWVFGYELNGTEIYIKLRLSPAPRKGQFGVPVVWSFHKAERRIKFPHRKTR